MRHMGAARAAGASEGERRHCMIRGFGKMRRSDEFRMAALFAAQAGKTAIDRKRETDKK